MKKRYVVLGLSLVFALALAVPAFGGPTNPIATGSATIKSVANKALKTAKKAQKTANTALSTANSANSAANTADSDAKKASTAAGAAQATANTANTAANSAQATANAAKSAAAAAEANAKTRVSNSTESLGVTSVKDTTRSKTSSAVCEASQVVLGGGYFVTGGEEEVTVTSNNNELYGHGWFATGSSIKGDTPNWSITSIVMCGTK
jgi:hypothetical protein